MSDLKFTRLSPGDPGPWFRQRSTGNPRYNFDTAAGRYLVLCFFGTAGDTPGRAAIQAAMARPDVFNDDHASFFGVSVDPADEKEARFKEKLPGYRYFWDFDGSASRTYGALPVDSLGGGAGMPMRRLWVVLDPTTRIIKVAEFRGDGGDAKEIIDFLAALPPPGKFPGFEVAAPILYLPNVFEPEFCAQLIALYEKHGGYESGFMREIDGKTVGMHDYSHKRRKDYLIEDQEVIRQTQAKIQRRIVPEIYKVHQFTATRMERYIVACYSAEDRGHFRQHRDNTTAGTAHRRFAVSINLSADFDGGDISFPEYSPRTYRPLLGGAVVFSCSLLHMVSPVTRGNRYAFLPFLYDEEAAKIREKNAASLASGSNYRADPDNQSEAPKAQA